MELRNYFEIFQRRRGVIIITVLVAALVAFVSLRFANVSYVASAPLRLGMRSGATLDYSTLEYAVRLKNTFADLAVSDPALTLVQQRINNARSIDELRESISVQFPNNNELMTVVVRDSDPALAAAIANEVAAILISENQRSASGRSFVVDLISAASVPLKSDTSTQLLIPFFGVLVSLAAGLGLALLLENLDTTIRNTSEVTSLVKLPLLGSVPKIRNAKAAQYFNGNSAEGEAFRLLRTNLAVYNQEKPLKTITITSAEPGEGKSLVAANLAYSLAQQGQQVVVVDGDLRIPTLHTIFNLPNEVGLVDLLSKKVVIEQAVRSLPDKKISVLTSGKLSSHNPADLLSSPELLSVIKELTEKFDAVIIDTPAFLAVADSTIISTLTDGVLMVVRCDKSRKEHVQTAFQQMVDANINLVGTVANSADRNPSYAYYQNAR